MIARPITKTAAVTCLLVFPRVVSQSLRPSGTLVVDDYTPDTQGLNFLNRENKTDEPE